MEDISIHSLRALGRIVLSAGLFLSGDFLNLHRPSADRSSPAYI